MDPGRFIRDAVELAMQLATDSNDYATGALGLVELALSYLNDRAKKHWSKAEIVEYVNQAQLSIADEINALCKEHFAVSATTPIVGDQAYYSLPADMVSALGLEVINDSSDREPQPLREVLLSDREFYEGLEKANAKLDYGRFFISGTSFKMLPEGDTSTGLIRIHYIKGLSRLSANADVSDIPVRGHELLSMDAARRALVKHGRINAALEKLRSERWTSLAETLLIPSRAREEVTRPWYGSFGPTMRSSGGQVVE